MFNYGENYFTDGTAVGFDSQGGVTTVVSKGQVIVGR